MTIAIGQFTITDFSDINISKIEPVSPVLDMLWLDTSATPYTLKSWNGAAWVASRALSLAELDAIQDAKLNTRITTFYQPTVPTSTAVGDFWVDTSNNNHLYRAECIGADEIADGEWVSARDNSAVEELEEFVDTIYTPGIANLQEQIDGKIDTWYQPHEPGPWTGKERIDHHGDMWYQTGTGILRRYNGSWNVWEIVESQTAADAYAKAAKADDTADGKRRVFTAQPYPPYDVGDLWTDGPEGELYRCINAKAHTPDVYMQEGLIILGAVAVFDQADWELATKYTDDSALTNFVANTYTPGQNSLQAQIDGKIETYFQETDPNTWTEADRAKHNGDMWYSSSTKLLKRYNGILNSWELIEDQKAIDAYTAASQAQDTADGKRRVFTTQPTPPYDVGDLWTEGSTGDLKRCKTAKDSEGVYSASDWELATKYTDDSALTNFVANTYTIDQNSLQAQIDGKIETYFQETDPNTWTEADRLKHNGDMWYSSSTKLLKRYNGILNSWELIEDQKAIDAYTAASQAQDTADGKRRVFTTQPTPPYDVGDLWTGGSTGDLKRCKTAKDSEGVYSASDWELATKYTDDSALTNFVANTYTPGQNSLQAQIDGKIETYFQETDPNTWTEADRLKHNGDMWYSSSTKLLKRYNGILNSWELIEDQKAIDAYTAASQAQDTADGKRRVFTTQPTPPYDVGDLWTEGSTGDLKRCKTAKDSEGVYSASDWELATKYTDDSALTNFVANTYTIDQSSLQAQIDGKIETYFQETDPNTWTEADRAKHNGDMWYSSSTKLLKRYNGILNSWELIEDQKAIDAYTAASQAQDTADGKRRVFTTQPTPPYDVGDLWTEGSTGDLKRCKTAKDSEGVYSASDWELATKYTDDSALTNFVANTYTPGQNSLQAQIDGKIETYFQETDPNTWTEADRAKHNGDMWYSSSTKLLKRYNGILNSWELIEDQKAIDAYTAASQAQDTADGKRRVFTTQPTPPYDVGDLWTEGSTGDLKRCKTAKDSEGVYSASDWELATKYTDDSALTNFVANTYTPGQNSLQAQIDGKIETYFQETDPNTWTEADRAKHNGDMWYSSSTKLLKRYNGILNSWELIEDQKAIDAYTAASQAQDTADGKRRVFTTQPTPPYDVGDLWTEGSTGDLKRCKTAKDSEGVYSASDWELATKYTDDSAANSKNTAFSACPSDGKYKKNDIMIPSEGFVSGAKTFYAGEIYQALADGDGLAFNPVHWAEASLISLWKKTGTITIDGGQIAADSVNATQLNGDTAMVNFLNALNLTAKYISASGITAGTLTLTANLNIESSDGNLEINGTQLKYTHADGTESRLGASGLRLYENGQLLPYISTVDAGMIDKFNETEGYWNYIVGNNYKKYFYLKRRGIRWLNQADNVKMLVTQGEELEWYDPSQYRHTGIKGMKYAVGDITNVAPSVTIRINYVGSYYSTNTMVYLDSNASDINGFYAQEYITINGETRKIVQYIANSHRAFVDEAFSSPPQYNDMYLIHSGPGGVNIEVESWYLAPWYSGSSGGEYYYPLTFGYMLILNN